MALAKTKYKSIYVFVIQGCAVIIPAYASQLELITLSLGDNVNGSIQDLCNLNNYKFQYTCVILLYC